jgi:chaperone modulatory protein CbpM
MSATRNPSQHEDYDALRVDQVEVISWHQLVGACGLAEDELRELVHYGALVPTDPAAPSWTFEARWLFVARTASRLRQEFDLDPHGVSVLLRFVERIEALEAELRSLRARGS